MLLVSNSSYCVTRSLFILNVHCESIASHCIGSRSSSAIEEYYDREKDSLSTSPNSTK